MPVVCQIAPPGLRATAYGVLNCTSCLVGGAMALAGGALKEWIGLGAALQLSAVMLMAAGMWLFRLGDCFAAGQTTKDDGLPHG
jgi:hypothetical protein